MAAAGVITQFVKQSKHPPAAPHHTANTPTVGAIKYELFFGQKIDFLKGLKGHLK